MAKSNIYIFTYNNYFNRIIKKENSLADYGTPNYTLIDTNFDYADGVTTQHVFNYNGAGDYLIVTDAENNILHRWFIIEPTKTRGGQHLLHLRRDLIIDYYDIVVTAPMIISRAMLNNPDNPLLFNSEGFSFNQIKKREILLKQYKNNNGYYYALYFAKDAVGAGVEDTESFPEISGSINLGEDIPYNISVGVPIEQSIYKTAIYKNITNQKLYITMLYDYDSRYSDRNKGAMMTLDSSNVATMNYPFRFSGSVNDILLCNTDAPTFANAFNSAFSGKYNEFLSYLQTQTGDIPNPISDRNLSLITEAANGNLTIKDSENKYWKVRTNITPEIINENSDGGVLWTWADGIIDNISDIRVQYNSDESTSYSYDKTTVRVWLEDITPATARHIDYEIDFSHFYNTNAPYNIVVIPANDQDMAVQLWNEQEQAYIPHAVQNKQVYNDKILENIMLKAGKWLLDVQILPYFPVKNYLDVDRSRINIGYNYYDSNYTDITKPEFYQNSALDVIYTHVNFGWWAYYVQNPSFEFDITNGHMTWDSFDIKVNDNDNPTAIDYKIENECTMYRISSPNFNGAFDFNLAKNKGLELINVDVTLRPYNPYYHINPKFNFLYGQDYNDCRGLICQGDFSLPIITDQFKNYEIENKNYQQMFNRQVEHLEFQQGQERLQAGFGIAAGTVSGAAMGALAGSKFGGVGAGVGAALGGATSLLGGVADLAMMSNRQREDKDYMVDNYRYQLGNIKALPTTINKITPLTNNNKIYPILECYTCTEEEKDLFRTYLNFKSMTVDKIGYISQYQQSERTFISGTLIRLEGTGLANNELFELYDELKKGVYI